MLATRRYIKATIELDTSELLARIQRLEGDHAAMRPRLEGERQVRTLAIQITGAAQTALAVGGAMERFAQALREPLPPPPRGRAGGLARARNA